MLLQNDSTGILTISLFESNKVNYKSIKSDIHLVGADKGSLILVQSSKFVSNSVKKGALLAIIESISIIKDSDFISNTGTGDYGVVHTEFCGMMRIYSSTFVHNSCGGVTVFESSDIAISSSLFSNNSEQYGTGVFLVSEHDVMRDKIGDICVRKKEEQTHNFQQKRHRILSVHNLEQLQAKQNATIDNCTFINNSAEVGGAICAINMTLTLANSFFTNNLAALVVSSVPSGVGGAVELVHCITSISGCIFDGNTASHGGGVCMENNSQVEIHSSVFANNNGTWRGIGFGGAVAVLSTNTVDNQTLSIVNSTFQQNKASIAGGAIYSAARKTKIRHCSFTGNNVTLGTGGAVAMHFASVSHSSFESNSASLQGGALQVLPGSKVTISHCNFTLNEASAGGAICGCDNGSLSCFHCYFYGNKAGFR